MSHRTAWVMVCGSRSCSVSTSSCQDPAGMYVGGRWAHRALSGPYEAPSEVSKRSWSPERQGRHPSHFAGGLWPSEAPPDVKGGTTRPQPLLSRPWALLRWRALEPAHHWGTCHFHGLEKERRPSDPEAGACRSQGPLLRAPRLEPGRAEHGRWGTAQQQVLGDREPGEPCSASAPGCAPSGALS